MTEKPKIPDYLEHRLEKEDLSDEEIESQLSDFEQLYEPINGHFTDYGEDGEKIFTDGGIEIRFTSRQIDVYSDLKAEEFLSVRDQDYPLEHVILITNLAIRNTRTGGALSLDEKIPYKVKVLLFPHNLGESDGYFDPSSGLVLITGDLTVPETIITLLHELGHGYDFWRQHPEESEADFLARSRYYASKMSGKPQMTRQQAGLILRSERVAWAYTVKKMRQLFPKLVKRKILRKIIHQRDLHSYSVNLQRFLDEKIEDGSGPDE